jgi:DNA helicase-2/ATP-dependent DNA helicase PcrA
MIRRIARLIEEGVNPGQILAVTFTRTAARDLAEQLLSLGVSGCNDVRACTLHSMCFSILAQQAAFQITSRSARPVLSHEKRALISDLAGQFGGRRAVDKLLDAYEAAWARLQTEIPGGPKAEIDLAFHAALVDWLRYHRSMLIGELVPLTLGFLQQNPAVPILPLFRHVLVDEYQDLNKADQTLIDLLANQGTLTVIGDDSQSIYGFRHANPEGIRSFPDEHPGTVCYTIEESRRCPPNIVEMSNSLIANDIRRSRRQPLKADPTKPCATVYVVQHATLDDEVTACADFVVHYLTRHPGLAPGQVLVLTPRRFIGNRIRDALIERKLNALSYFLEDELQAPSAAEGFCLLTLLVDPVDRTAMRAWIGMGHRNERADGYQRLRQISQELQLELSETINAVSQGKLRVAHTQGIEERWQELQARLASLCGLQGLELTRALWPPENEDCEDLRLMAENIANEFPEPKQLLEALRQEITQPQLPDSKSDIVRVMSLHKSKGLTAALILVAGCVAGALPTIHTAEPQAIQDFELEEQRRLFYVAITRANDTVVVSSCIMLPSRDALQNGISVIGHCRRGGEDWVLTAASPFIADLGVAAPAPVDTAMWRAQAGF